MMTDITRVWKAVVEVETDNKNCHVVEHLFLSDLTAKQWVAQYIDSRFNVRSPDWQCLWKHSQESEEMSMSTYIDGKHVSARIYVCKVHP